VVECSSKCGGNQERTNGGGENVGEGEKNNKGKIVID
jgi:hypothetical protein